MLTREQIAKWTPELPNAHSAPRPGFLSIATRFRSLVDRPVDGVLEIALEAIASDIKPLSGSDYQLEVGFVPLRLGGGLGLGADLAAWQRMRAQQALARRVEPGLLGVGFGRQ